MGAKRAVIVGGGLAGMTVALELAKRGFPVTILESEFRLGGKAGSQRRRGFWEDHGYHIFPAWYGNTRRLLGEIGVLSNLIDLHQFHFLKRGAFPNFVSMKEWSTFANLLHNFQAGMLPWAETILSYYFLLDLAAEPFSNRAFLDRISASGFLRSRFYATEGIAEVHHQSALQGSAIPYYEVSAMTIQKLVRAWFKAPSPLVSILNGPLQEKFIDPFSRRLEELGVKIIQSARVTHLQSRYGAIRAARLESGHEVEGDVFVLATPLLEALQLVDGRIYEEEQRKLVLDPDRFGLVDLAKLHSAPMAAFHVHFDRRIKGLPREHVMLQESRFGMSFIDVSQHWGLPHTSLSVIASNFSPLGTLTADWDYEPVKRSVVQELHEYIPEISVEDLESERMWLQPHVKHPLFLNTVGSWHFRPESRDGTGVPNLFVTGDYCRSDADLTTMESAVWSALQAAAGILERAGIHDVTEPLPIQQYPPALLTAMKYAGLPLMIPLSWWVKFRERRDKPPTDDRRPA